MQKNEIRPYRTSYTQIDSKWVKTTETITLLEKNTGEKFLDIGLDHDFLDRISKAQIKKA